MWPRLVIYVVGSGSAVLVIAELKGKVIRPQGFGQADGKFMLLFIQIQSAVKAIALHIGQACALIPGEPLIVTDRKSVV